MPGDAAIIFLGVGYNEESWKFRNGWDDVVYIGEEVGLKFIRALGYGFIIIVEMDGFRRFF